MTHPYYRFTDWMFTKNACREWFDHFMAQEKSVCIVQSSRDFRYAVFVMGKEASDLVQNSNKEKLSGKIVDSYTPRKKDLDNFR